MAEEFQLKGYVSNDELGVIIVCQGENSEQFFNEIHHRKPKSSEIIFSEVKEIETGDRNAVLITDQYGNRVDVLILVNEDTVIENTKGEKLALADIKEGSEITAYHSIAMTMSIPGQTNGFKLVVEQ